MRVVTWCHSMGQDMEQLPHNPGIDSAVQAERMAEKALDALLDDPDNAFLSTIPMNVRVIEAAETAVEALAIARARIEERDTRTFILRPVAEIEGVEALTLNYPGVRHTLREISERNISVGEGGDAFVVASKSETERGTSELCYKFARAQGTNRGRNSMDQELDLQRSFYQCLQAVPGLRVGIPEPLYYCEMGSKKMIAMERLTARSVDHLQHGLGSIPDWVTDEHIDTFCDELERSLDILHERGLYHRDLHLGNIMFTQSSTEVEKLGFIIDFGLSGFGQEGMDPYRKEQNGTSFTYDDDYGRIKTVRTELKRLKQGSL